MICPECGHELEKIYGNTLNCPSCVMFNYTIIGETDYYARIHNGNTLSIYKGGMCIQITDLRK